MSEISVPARSGSIWLRFAMILVFNIWFCPCVWTDTRYFLRHVNRYMTSKVWSINGELTHYFIIWCKWFVTLQYAMIGSLENQKVRHFSSNESYQILVIKPWSTNFPYKSSWYSGPTNSPNIKSPILVQPCFLLLSVHSKVPAWRKFSFLTVSFLINSSKKESK